MGLAKKKSGSSGGLSLAIISVCLGVAALIVGILLGWPNIRHYVKSPGPVYASQSNEPLRVVLENSKVREKLKTYRFYVVQPALMSPITKGRYQGHENYKWRVEDMYISFLENMLCRNQLQYYIDRNGKKIFIWQKGHFEIF